MTAYVVGTGIRYETTTVKGSERKSGKWGQFGIFAYGGTNVGLGGGSSIVNILSNTGVIASDYYNYADFNGERMGLSGASYGIDKAILGFGYVNTSDYSNVYSSYTNLISNTGVVASHLSNAYIGSVYNAGASYGTDKAIFGYGFNGDSEISKTNLVSNVGVLGSDVTGVGTARWGLAAARYGGDKAIFGYGYFDSDPTEPFGQTPVSASNKVSNTGVVASDTGGVGTARSGLAAATYGGDKAIFAYGVVNLLYSYTYCNMSNLVSNTGVVASDVTGVGTTREGLAAAGYAGDRAVFAYGQNGSFLNLTNLVSATGVISSDTTGAGTARSYLAGTSFSS